MVITTFFETLDGLWLYCYTSCMLGRAPRTKDFILIFVKIWILINGAQLCGIGPPKFHRNYAS